MANFTIVKKGYDQDEVNEHISKLEEIIKSYKDKDVAIKNAIVSAQVAADNIIKNAELQSTSYKLKAIEDLSDIQNRISMQKEKLVNFKNDYDTMVKKYISTIDNNDVEAINRKIDSINQDFKKIHTTLTAQANKDLNKKD